MITHLIPKDDLIEHQPSSTCKCAPVILNLKENKTLIRHNSYDGRERELELTDGKIVTALDYAKWDVITQPDGATQPDLLHTAD